jgi:hypothetical protein
MPGRLAAEANRRHDLPRALGAFVGRDADVARLTRVLSEACLVTLTGVGAVGKTRLALALAAAVSDQHADGVCLAELAGLSEATLVPYAVGAALGVREEPARSAIETLSARVGARQLLLVIDNCEHLVASCAEGGKATGGMPSAARRCDESRSTPRRWGVGVECRATFGTRRACAGFCSGRTAIRSDSIVCRASARSRCRASA